MGGRCVACGEPAAARASSGACPACIDSSAIRDLVPSDDDGRFDPATVVRFRRALDSLPLIRRPPAAHPAVTWARQLR
jgi:hypothetical protein